MHEFVTSMHVHCKCVLLYKKGLDMDLILPPNMTHFLHQSFLHIDEEYIYIYSFIICEILAILNQYIWHHKCAIISAWFRTLWLKMLHIFPFCKQSTLKNMIYITLLYYTSLSKIDQCYKNKSCFLCISCFGNPGHMYQKCFQLKQDKELNSITKLQKYGTNFVMYITYIMVCQKRIEVQNNAYIKDFLHIFTYFEN